MADKYNGRSPHSPLDLREWLGPDGQPASPQSKLDLRPPLTRDEGMFYETIPMASAARPSVDFNDSLPTLRMPNWLSLDAIRNLKVFGQPVLAAPRRRFWFWLVACLSAVLMLMAAGALLMNPSVMGTGSRGGSSLGGGLLPDGGATPDTTPTSATNSAPGSTATPASGSSPTGVGSGASGGGVGGGTAPVIRPAQTNVYNGGSGGSGGNVNVIVPPASPQPAPAPTIPPISVPKLPVSPPSLPQVNPTLP